MDKHMEEARNRDALREGQQETKVLVSAAKQKRDWNTIRTGLYTAIAVMLVMSAVMGTAWAYFTTYAKAKGGVVLNLGHQETIDEDFKSWEKTLDITSESDSRPVYLRAKAYSIEYPVTYSNSQNWTEGDDGWMYYTLTLAPGTSLSDSGDQLKVQINDVPAEDLEDGKTFNVIVVYESTEVQYDENGEQIDPMSADWAREVDTNRTSTDLGGE